MMISVLVFFKQWETNLDLYVNNRFLLMLKVKSRSNRLTYMARIMNLAKGVMKNCEDEPSADQFVQDCQRKCDSIYEKDTELD